MTGILLLLFVIAAFPSHFFIEHAVQILYNSRPLFLYFFENSNHKGYVGDESLLNQPRVPCFTHVCHPISDAR